MDQKTFRLIEEYMKACMCDSSHDTEHVYRVLYTALAIADTEENVDYDVLTAACLLHDIGRKEQFENPAVCHAQAGAEKAYGFLMQNGFDGHFSEKVRHCIVTHRFRNNNPPESIEAKILFDADKIDVTGIMGIARSLIYKGTVGEPLYRVLPDGNISDGSKDTEPSFFQEYKYKLEKVYDRFFTEMGMKIAKERQTSAVNCYNALYHEVTTTYLLGKRSFDKHICQCHTV